MSLISWNPFSDCARALSEKKRVEMENELGNRAIDVVENKMGEITHRVSHSVSDMSSAVVTQTNRSGECCRTCGNSVLSLVTLGTKSVLALLGAVTMFGLACKSHEYSHDYCLTEDFSCTYKLKEFAFTFFAVIFGFVAVGTVIGIKAVSKESRDRLYYDASEPSLTIESNGSREKLQKNATLGKPTDENSRALEYKSSGDERIESPRNIIDIVGQLDISNFSSVGMKAGIRQMDREECEAELDNGTFWKFVVNQENKEWKVGDKVQIQNKTNWFTGLPYSMKNMQRDGAPRTARLYPLVLSLTEMVEKKISIIDTYKGRMILEDESVWSLYQCSSGVSQWRTGDSVQINRISSTSTTCYYQITKGSNSAYADLMCFLVDMHI